jgi:uncharacterized tellurite resistance protein B-like protein
MAMIAAIRRTLLMIQGKRITPEELAHISKTYDFRIALAALLVHAGNISGSFVDAAREQVRVLLMRQLNLSAADASELMVIVNYRHLQWEEVEELVLALSDALAPQGRARLIEWLWQIVVADRVITQEESELITSVATMLGIPGTAQDAIAANYRNRGELRSIAPREAQNQQPAGRQLQLIASDPSHPN